MPIAPRHRHPLNWLIPISGLLALACSTTVSAGAVRPPAECVAAAARAFAIEPVVLELILDVEGGWPGAERRNANGSADLGVMQVNTVHVAYFAQFGISREELRDNACINLYAGAHLLAKHLRRRDNLARAMADYHSKTPEHAARYLTLIQGAIQRRLAAAQREDAAIASSPTLARMQPAP